MTQGPKKEGLVCSAKELAVCPTGTVGTRRGSEPESDAVK